MNVFLQINGLNGTSMNPRYPGAMELISFSIGAHHQRLAISQGLGDYLADTSASDITATKLVDGLSERIVSAVINGHTFPKAVLTVESGTPQSKRLQITMNGVVFTAVSAGGSSERGLPLESMTLGFQRVQVIQQ